MKDIGGNLSGSFAPAHRENPHPELRFLLCEDGDVDKEQTQQLAAEWYAAWNAHDLERILSHYSDDVVFVSPFAVEIAGRADGRLEGREALRSYFGAALERFPDLKFEPIALMTGLDSLVLHYHSVQNLLAAELMIVGEDGLVTEVRAHYGSD